MAMESNSNLNEQLKLIDDRVTILKNSVLLAEDLIHLHQDERFQRVILDGYFGNEAERLFGVLVTPSTIKRDVMENIHDKLSAIRNIKQFFVVVEQNAIMAPDQIQEEEDYRKEVTEYFANQPIDAEIAESE